MKKINRLSSFASSFTQSIISLARLIILSRQPFPRENNDGEIIILGNGPSLKDTIRENIDRLTATTLMSVNFAANSPEWQLLKPAYHILADPHFFNREGDPNVERLWDNLRKAEFEVKLLVPCSELKKTAKFLNNSSVKAMGYNLTAVEGFRWMRESIYRYGIGMPRPRNVLVPAIMNSIRLGYRTLYLAGADHSWTRTLYVNKDNRLVTIQPHFYEDNEEEKHRVASVYSNVRLYEMLESLTIAFRSYWDIQAFAESMGIKIYNVTPESFIDAFERTHL